MTYPMSHHERIAHRRIKQAVLQDIHSELLGRTTAEPLPLISRVPGSRQWRELIVTALIARDGTRCYLCRTELDANACHIDHVIPTSLGGPNELTNVRLTCADCNTRKGSRIVSFLVSSGRPCYSLGTTRAGSP